MLKDSKEALDAALERKMVALATAADARCKRQAEAVAATQASILEIEDALRTLDASQRDLVDEANTAGGENPPVDTPRNDVRRRPR